MSEKPHKSLVIGVVSALIATFVTANVWVLLDLREQQAVMQAEHDLMVSVLEKHLKLDLDGKPNEDEK